jgi:ABC-2 type transport system ATP-binding protein
VKSWGSWNSTAQTGQRLSAELFEKVGLHGFENKKLRTYSQEMKKRYSLALALLSDSRNYLFDEILNGLDRQGFTIFDN